ncbi:hypothetical protein KAJ27_17705, partial [bacterium]|nr:hypothetical protein [bacterium]
TLNAQMISLDQDQLSNMYRNIAIEKFNEDMNKIKEYYVLLSLDNGTIKRCDYMDSITKMRETITDNYNPGNEYPIDVEYSVYLELYVDYITNLDIENRDAYLPLNSQLNEYFQNSLLQARENNLNAEIKLYENAINKITYLVGRA